MTGSEFLRRLRRLGRQRGVVVRIEARHGKGSHIRVYYGSAFTTLQDRKRELPRKTLKMMLSNLGLSESDL